jgi:hypothetical protein
MTWVRLDDQAPDHPKFARTGTVGFALHIAAMCYASRYLTDGFVPELAALKLLPDQVVSPRQLAEMVSADLWERVEGGYRVHDFLVNNKSKDLVVAEREPARERMAAVREKFARSSPSPYPAGNPAGNPSHPGQSVPTEPTGARERAREKPASRKREVRNGHVGPATADELRAEAAERESTEGAGEPIERAAEPEAAAEAAWETAAEELRGWMRPANREMLVGAVGLRDEGHRFVVGVRDRAQREAFEGVLARPIARAVGAQLGRAVRVAAVVLPPSTAPPEGSAE